MQTSYNSALASREIVEELSGIHVTMEIASDLLDRQGPIYAAMFIFKTVKRGQSIKEM